MLLFGMAGACVQGQRLEPTADLPEGPTTVLFENGLTVPVIGFIGTVNAGDNPVDLLEGAPHDPSLVTGPQGREQPFDRSVASWPRSIEIRSRVAIYLGDIGERSVFIHDQDITPRQRREAAALGATLDSTPCLLAGSYDDPVGGVNSCGWSEDGPVAGRFIRNGTGSLEEIFVYWIGVPDTTAAVTLSTGAVSLWQTPVARTVFFTLDQAPEQDLELTVLNANGDSIDTGRVPVEWWSPQVFTDP